MSTTKTKIKSRYREQKCNPVFHAQDKQAVEDELSPSLLKSAKRTGQLNLAARNLGRVPERVWKINEIPIENNIELDFNRTSSDKPWWHTEPLCYLDLSSNSILDLSPDIKNLGDLTTLMLQNNSLTQLPAEFGELRMLKMLNLSHNKLTTLPKELFKMIELRTLILSHNEIESLEPDIGDLIMLNKLDLSHNNLTLLPPGLGYLVRLTEIDISHNKLTELPPDIVNQRDLLKLDVTHNELKCLPPMSELRRMVALHCNHNNIEELPDFYGCTALREIHMANNFLKEVTDEFCEQMQNLKILNVRDNQIEKLPDNISLLQHLIRFDITNNNLSALPSNLGLLAHLQNLQLEGNKVLALRRGVMQGGTSKVLKFLRDKISPDEADPDHEMENKWPDKYAMRKNQSILLAGKDLTVIPDEVFEAAASENVHSIDLGKNKIKQFPLSIIKVSDHLTELVLCCNQLTNIPSELSQCSNLQYLELSKNQITDLPIELGSLKLLRELVISFNRLTKIPTCIYNMSNLEILLAADNQITEINVSSDALSKLKFLTVFELSNNNIMSVPPELGNFSQLKSLQLFGNPFKQPRHAILEKGTPSILSYLRDRIPA